MISPTWSPDGKQIAITSRRDGNNEIYSMNADGSQPKRLTNNLNDDFAPAWSPDGTQIAISGNKGGITDLYVVNVASGAVKRTVFSIAKLTRPRPFSLSEKAWPFTLK